MVSLSWERENGINRVFERISESSNSVVAGNQIRGITISNMVTAGILINFGKSTGLPTGCGIQRLSQFYLNVSKLKTVFHLQKVLLIGAVRGTWIRKDRQRQVERPSQESKKDKKIKIEEITTMERTKNRGVKENRGFSGIRHKRSSPECQSFIQRVLESQ